MSIALSKSFTAGVGNKRFGWRIITLTVAAAFGSTTAATDVAPEVLPDGALVGVQDRALLVAVYEATDGPNWRQREGWLSAKPLADWAGVVTENGRVVSLRLNNNRLRGAIPRAIGELTGLRRLELAGNQLRGPIPPALQRLERLAHLDLRWNDLQGGIPRELGRLSTLRSLLLANNRLNGEIPPSLGDLSALSRLDLSNNRLSGPVPPTFAEFWNLRALSLRHNRLTGRVPTLPNATTLERLLLNNNEFSGQIPTTLGDRKNLTHLNLASNRLHGHIPKELGQLPKLEWLSLGRNQLRGTIPPEIGDMASLRHLDVQAARDPAGDVSELPAGNPLYGLLPAQLGNLKRIGYLDISGTQLSGSLPAGLGEDAEHTQIVLDDAQCETNLRGPETSRTSHTCGGVNPSRPPANAAAMLPISTGPLPEGQFLEMATQAMAAMAIVDGHAAMDAARIPAWMDPAEHERTVERFNDHIRNAGFVIRSADDLLRAMETYDGPTAILPADDALGTEVPAHILEQAPRDGASNGRVGTQLPVVLGRPGPRAANPSRTGNAPTTSATNQIIARLRCDVGVDRPRRRGDYVEATAGGSCSTTPVAPDIPIPTLDWTLYLILQRNEGWFFWRRWVTTGTADHRQYGTYNPWWIDVDVRSRSCANGLSWAWGAIEVTVQPPFRIVPPPGLFPVGPAWSTVRGCMKPPGDCRFAQYEGLNAAVTRHCKTSPPLGCAEQDTCSTLRSKLRDVNRCIEARRNRDNRCFAGGDAGHREQIAQRQRQAGRCGTLLTKGNCIEWWPF